MMAELIKEGKSKKERYAISTSAEVFVAYPFGFFVLSCILAL